MKGPLQIASTVAEIIGIADISTDSGLAHSLSLCPAKAAFLPPTDDFVEQRLILHNHLVRNESSIFLSGLMVNP